LADTTKNEHANHENILTKYLAKDDPAGTKPEWLNSIVVQQLRKHKILNFNVPCVVINGCRRSDSNFSGIANTGSANIHLAMYEDWSRKQ